MAKVTVPGLKASTGMKSFEPISSGRYKLKCIATKIEPPANAAPSDVWKFQFEITDGPEQPDGKSPKGRKYFDNVTIMHPEHPSYREDQMGVDTLKSMCLAFGVVPGKGDTLDPDAFLGLEAEADIIKKLEKNESTGEEIPRNRVNKWIQA